jgi:hypothetical protein
MTLARRVSESASTIGTGSKNVTTAGTQVQLTATATPCSWLTVTARPANTGYIAVGGSAVDCTAGSEQAFAILDAGQSVSVPVNDVSKVYIDSTVNGEGVAFGYGL